MRLSRQIGVVCAVLLVIVCLIALAKAKQYADSPMASAQAEFALPQQPLPTAPAPAAPPAESPAASGQPQRWQGHRFDGVFEHLSSEDGRRAQMTVERYLENFDRIETLSLHDQQTMTIQSSLARLASRFVPFRENDNYSYDVEITRTPPTLKINGVQGGSPIHQVLTVPAGEGEGGGMWLAQYLHGEYCYVERSALKHGTAFREARRMVDDIPGMEGILRSPAIQNAEYDVLEEPLDGGRLIRSLWFNRGTGMLDFITCVKPTAKRVKNGYFFAMYVEYQAFDGIFYPKRTVSFDWGLIAKKERTIKGLSINGRPAAKEE